jgi:hypothetical protein
MVVAVLLVMLVRDWIPTSRAGWGSNAGRTQSECDSHGAKQDQKLSHSIHNPLVSLTSPHY